MLNKLKKEKVIAIFRGLPYEEVIWRVELLLENELSIVEVTLNSPDALHTIEKLKTQFLDEIEVGAGTVTRSEEVVNVKNAGGTFIISPHFDIKLVQETKANKLVSIPGVMTATEVFHAANAGADMMKIFPAISLGTSYAKQLKGPFPNLSFMATGGINKENAYAFIESGYEALGIGSSLTACNDPRKLKEQINVYKQMGNKKSKLGGNNIE